LATLLFPLPTALVASADTNATTWTHHLADARQPVATSSGTIVLGDLNNLTANSGPFIDALRSDGSAAWSVELGWNTP
jgi:hypothetical protein